MIRIGQSSDIHPLVKNRPLIIGGVWIEYHLGLMGHSDADALCHAIAEALIGALGLGDIGKHFPDTDKQYQGISSLIILSKIAELVANEGYQIINIDSLVIIEKPKLAGYILQMRTNIAQALGIDIAMINVKATRAEGLSFIGREEGVMAQAVVLIETK